jgi:hypothetical protein
MTKAAIAKCNAKRAHGRTARDLMKVVWDYQVMLDEYMEKKGITQAVIDTLACKPDEEELLELGSPWIVPSDCKVMDCLDCEDISVYVHEGSDAEAELKKINSENAEAVKRIFKRHPLDVWVWNHVIHDWDMMNDWDTESDASSISSDSSDESYQGQIDELDDRIDNLEDKITRIDNMVSAILTLIKRKGK